ncbi:hypothetical protein NFI96_023808 [Prochilodus magdalenae]|nr:hypothetical protein NFI96_023808 [Prochilodus magdalenae]
MFLQRGGGDREVKMERTDGGSGRRSTPLGPGAPTPSSERTPPALTTGEVTVSPPGSGVTSRSYCRTWSRWTLLEMIHRKWRTGARFLKVRSPVSPVPEGEEPDQKMADRKPGRDIRNFFSPKTLFTAFSSVPSTDTSTNPSIPTSTAPSRVPSADPSTPTSTAPSTNPSTAPSRVPSTNPSRVPSTAPSRVPSTAPSRVPSTNPSTAPSRVPSTNPSTAPSRVPSTNPSRVPSTNPSTAPSRVPSTNPSTAPSRVPSTNPSRVPSTAPSRVPSTASLQSSFLPIPPLLPPEFLLPIPPLLPPEFLLPIPPEFPPLLPPEFPPLLPPEFLLPIPPLLPPEFLLPIPPLLPPEFLLPIPPLLPPEFLLPIPPLLPPEFLLPIPPLLPPEFLLPIPPEFPLPIPPLLPPEFLLPIPPLLPPEFLLPIPPPQPPLLPPEFPLLIPPPQPPQLPLPIPPLLPPEFPLPIPPLLPPEFLLPIPPEFPPLLPPEFPLPIPPLLPPEFPLLIPPPQPPQLPLPIPPLSTSPKPLSTSSSDLCPSLGGLQMKVEEDQGQGNDTNQPQKRRSSGHSFRFRYRYKKYEVTCDWSVTVQEALRSNKNFKNLLKPNEGKYVVIQREKEPRGAVSPDFPCCLINEDELLDITFIKPSGNSRSEDKPVVHRSLMSDPTNFIVFNIKTTGGKDIKRLMKNQALKHEVDNVWVYALKGEKVRKALQRDGRFNNVIFQKHCGLSELGSETITDMSNRVNALDAKHFKVEIIDKQLPSQESSQEFGTVNNESGEGSPGSPRAQSESADHGENAVHAQQQKPQPSGKERRSNIYGKRIQVKEIPNTGEILKLLRDQYEGLVKQLKERESLTKPAEVQRFFREEYDKSVQSFSEVKRVKELMKRSDSVCLIRVMGSGRGTGFLLCGRLILTNAHVVEEAFDQGTWRLRRTVTAVFGYEGWGMGKELEVKADVVAYCKDEQGQHLDFALLELAEDADLPDCPELLSDYSLPPTKGGVCIIGHPDVGVKRMDPCFLIENVPKAVERHLAENSGFVHVITQECLGQKFCPSQINYDSCFFHGSSGSPVFNDHCQLIGVHTGGYVYKGEGGRTRSVMEYALPVNSILEHIDRQCRQRGRPPVVETFEAQSTMQCD